MPKKKGKPREPQARGKWLTASVTGDIPAFIATTFGEAGRRDPGHAREWVVLVDRNAWSEVSSADRSPSDRLAR